jgi:hypothetical protein
VPGTTNGFAAESPSPVELSSTSIFRIAAASATGLAPTQPSPGQRPGGGRVGEAVVRRAVVAALLELG